MKPVPNSKLMVDDIVEGSCWMPTSGGKFSVYFGHVIVDSHVNGIVRYHYSYPSSRGITECEFWQDATEFIQWAWRII